MGAGRDLINRSGCRDVEGGVIGVSPGKVRWLLRHDDRSQMMAGWIPNPYALGADHIEVSLAIDPHAIGHAVILAARFDAEDASVA